MQTTAKGYPFSMHLLVATPFQVSATIHRKCKFFDTWIELNKVNGELTELFKSLSSMLDQIKSIDVNLLGSFLMKVYQQNSKRDISLDIFRMNQFSKCTSFNPRNLTLSRKGLLEHTKWAALQEGWIWKECEFNVPNQCLTNCGSCRNIIDGNFLPK